MAFSMQGELLAMEQQSFESLYPHPGWVEQDPELIWASVLSTLRTLLTRLTRSGHRAIALGVTNQRETSILWNRRTGAPIYNAIVWQDRRTAGRCRELAAAGHEAVVTERTGLRLDPYFSATKLGWILDEVPDARRAAQAGELAAGTIDSFLIWRLTGARLHITDATNASRTALYDIGRDRWDEELCELFGVPPRCLPEVRDSAGDFGIAQAQLVGQALPIRAVVGDQQAALVGQGCLSAGDLKCTYGTGAFMVANTGGQRLHSATQLLGTIAYRLDGQVTYALEGSILSAGSVVRWLRDSLGLFTRSEGVEALARSVSDSGGVYLVPAFTGLGAPYWDPQARAAIVGLTPGSGRGQIARAALDCVALQSCDLLAAMARDGLTPLLLKIDGGMARNSLFCQRLADLTGLCVQRPRMSEATAFGAACLAGLGEGVFGSLEQIGRLWQADRLWEPELDPLARQHTLAGWRAAVTRVLST
jgi:glycerol kinase